MADTDIQMLVQIATLAPILICGLLSRSLSITYKMAYRETHNLCGLYCDYD